MTERTRLASATAALLVLAASTSMLVFDLHAPVRVLPAVAFVVLVPGYSVVGLLRLDDVATNVALSTTFSLVLGILAAQLLVWQGWYSAERAMLCLSAISLPCLLVQVRQELQERAGVRAPAAPAVAAGSPR